MTSGLTGVRWVLPAVRRCSRASCAGRCRRYWAVVPIWSPHSLKEGLAPAGARLRLPAARWRAVVIVAQVTVAVVLLVGAVLLGTSFVSLLAADRGFQPAGVLTVSLPMPDSIPSARRQEIVESAVERLQTVPGVLAVGFTSNLPFSGSTAVRVFTMPAQGSASERFVQAGYQIVSPALPHRARVTARRWTMD